MGSSGRRIAAARMTQSWLVPHRMPFVGRQIRLMVH
jgi:hypothetical protein